VPPASEAVEMLKDEAFSTAITREPRRMYSLLGLDCAKQFPEKKVHSRTARTAASNGLYRLHADLDRGLSHATECAAVATAKVGVIVSPFARARNCPPIIAAAGSLCQDKIVQRTYFEPKVL
jgi:hypothetical protein